MNEPVESLLIKEFFPSTREEWRKHNPLTTGKKMTRQEHIDNARVGVEGFPMGLRRTYYTAYIESGWHGSKEMPTFEDAVFRDKPWIANDEEFAKWQTLEPFDRFRLMVIGLPWNDETIALLKSDDGAGKE